jgi:hypothetical protein
MLKLLTRRFGIVVETVSRRITDHVVGIDIRYPAYIIVLMIIMGRRSTLTESSDDFEREYVKFAH